MLKDKTVQIGRILSSYGLGGQVILGLDQGVTFIPDKPEVVFLKRGDMLVPYFVEDLVKPDKLKLEEVNSPEDAAKLRNAEVYVYPDLVEIIAVKAEGAESLTGFEVMAEGETVGIIQYVEEFPQQWMLFVLQGEDEILIPFVEDWIERIEPESKQVFMNLPDGLLSK